MTYYDLLFITLGFTLGFLVGLVVQSEWKVMP